MKLTPRQQQILDLIRRHIGETGYPPTRAEIAGALGFRSVNAAEDHLRALERRGAVQLQKGASRGIRLLQPFGVGEGLPVVGRVAAGSPILALEHIEEHYRLDPGLFRLEVPASASILGTDGRELTAAEIAQLKTEISSGK